MGANREVALAYREGSSDKVYNVGIYTKDNGFVVDFQYGRRGSTLQTGTKTAGPVPLVKATAIFDKVVAEKLAKGYSPGAAGVPYQHTEQEQRATGVYPQLLNAIEEADLPGFLKNDRYVAQEKHDGKRVLIQVAGDCATGINRKGLTIGLPQPIIDQAVSLNKHCLLDGECVGGTFYAFDLLTLDDNDLRSKRYLERYALMDFLGPSEKHDAIRVVFTARGLPTKQALLEKLRIEGREGIVFKDLNAAYVPGRPSSGGPQLKFKFTATATCVVTKLNEGLRSVALGMENGPIAAVGNVTIPANFPIPKVGDLVEIRYLNWQPGGSLYQPVYLGKRDDLEKPDSMATLKIKAATGDNDADES